MKESRALRAMPATVKIGSKIIDVRATDCLRESRQLGHCNWFQSDIAVERHQSSHELVNTLLHEVLHLHCRKASAEHVDDFRKIEEYIVNLMAISFCEIVTDNPELVRWMVNTLKRPDEDRERMREYAPDAEEE